MKITKEDVIKTANLARLNPDEKLMEKLALQIEDILKYVDTLQDVDTEGIEPAFHVIEKTNAFREDERRPHAKKEEVLCNAPKSDDENFIVPKVI